MATSHTPMDERLRVAAERLGATCTWRCISAHPIAKLVGLNVEVLEYDGPSGHELCFVNPVTQQAERLSPNQIGGPLDKD